MVIPTIENTLMHLLRNTLLASAALLLASFQLTVAARAETVQPAATPAPTTTATPSTGQSTPTFAIIEWRIRKGHDKEFLDYWATTSTIPDRSGLIGEFLSKEQDARAKFPWINWPNRSSDEYTVYYNIGIWRSEDDYVAQIGKYANNAKPPMPFEYDHRTRVLVQPVEWRRGPANLPTQDADGVK